jgi:MFS family permease
LRRSVVPIYGLFLLETLAWIAMVPLAPTFADAFGLSDVETGLILAAASLAALVFAFPLGVLADRFGARRVTIASACLFTLATLGQGLADEFSTLLLSRIAFGVAFGALWGAGASWLSDSLSDERRAGALALATTVGGVGFTIGPVFAGVLADRFDTGTPFLVLAVAAAAVTAGLFVTAPVPTATAPEQRPLRVVLRLARADELVLAGIAIIVLIGLVGGGVNLLVPLQLRDNGVSAAEIGLLFSVASAVYTVVSAGVARLGSRSATLRVGGYAALLSGLTFVLVLTSTSTLAAVAFVLLRAPPWSTMDTIIYPLAAAGAHRSAIGRGSVMGLVMLGWAAASTAGPLLAGAIAEVAGPRAAFAVMIGFCVLVGGWLLFTGARVRGQRPAVDLERLYRAGDLEALRAEYDRVAVAYDGDLADMGYRSPREVATVVRKLVPSDARILDVGAGTGLLGAELSGAGYSHLDGLDLSPGMLEEARRKHVYLELREGRLGDDLDYASGSFDGVVASGVLTTGHAPARSLDELVRITRPGGHVIFTLRSDDGGPHGFDDKIAALSAASRWELVERGDEFQAMPVGEPSVLVRVWAFRVL